MNSDFGEYQLLRLLGEGGMAQVWEARRRSLHGPRRCAVKIAKSSSDAHREMFARECRLALALSGHDNVVSVLDMGTHRGRPYLVMELVDGVTLAEMNQRVGGPWSIADAVAVVVGILRSLGHVHTAEVEESESQSIVHRDVTPHNVMVSSRGQVKLLDFGIAQRADAEPSFDQALGKLSYVPREQVEGEPDQRSDLYAAGAVLFELLDGRRFRWHCADEDALFQEIYRDRVPSLRRKDVPAPVLAVLRGLLQPARERRISTAAEALARLEAWQAKHQAGALEKLYASAVGSRAHVRASSKPSFEAVDAPQGRRPWDDVRASGEHLSSRPASAANDSGRSRKASGRSGSIPDLAASSSPAKSGVVQRRSRSRTVSVPAWSAKDAPPRGVTGEDLAEDAATTMVPAAKVERRASDSAPAELIERFATRRHPASLPEQDAPMARRSAEIAVTQPQPSHRAPWADGTEPIERRVARPEPGAPVKRRRDGSSTGASYSHHDRTGSVSPRQRESASMHHAAGDSGEVSGEILTDEEPPGFLSRCASVQGMRQH